MIGTDIRGGIKALVQVYAARGLFARWNVEYVPTHRDGSAFPRSSCWLQARCGVFGLMFTRRVSIVHAHLASGSSFWRRRPSIRDRGPLPRAGRAAHPRRRGRLRPVDAIDASS